MLRKALPVLCLFSVCAFFSIESRAAQVGEPGRRWVDSKKKASPEYRGPKILLKTGFKPGSYKLAEEQKSTMRMGIMGQSQTIRQSISVTGDMKITRPDATGEQRLSFTCRSVKFSMSVAGRTMNFDSKGPAHAQNPQLAAVMRPLVGWKGTLIGRDGKFTRVEGIESLMARISASSPPSTAQQTAKLRQTLQKFLKEMLTRHWGELIPKKPIGPGDAWDAKLTVESVPFLGKTSFDCYCLLEDVRESATGKIAIIDFAYQAKLRDHAVDMSQLGPMPPGASVKIGKMDILGTATAHFDTDIGFSTYAKIDLQADFDMTIRAQGQTMSMHMDVKTTSTNTMKKVN